MLYIDDSVEDLERVVGAKQAAKALSKQFTMSVIEGLCLPSVMTQSAAKYPTYFTASISNGVGGGTFTSNTLCISSLTIYGTKKRR